MASVGSSIGALWHVRPIGPGKGSVGRSETARPGERGTTTAPYDPARHHRHSIRLPSYDYARPGAYFVTVVTHDRQRLFGAIVDGAMRLNECGEAVRRGWLDLPQHYPGVCLDECVIMPNHVHGVIVLQDDPAADRRSGLPEIVRNFKTFSARAVNARRAATGVPVWQRNYYEHVVRDGAELDRVRAYIAANPARWAVDHENPDRLL